jgi:hypothetical protein
LKTKYHFYPLTKKPQKLDFNDQNIMKGDFNRNYVSGEGQDFFDGFEISTALFFGENCHIFFLQQATLTYRLGQNIT